MTDKRLTETESRDELIRRFAYQNYLKRKRLNLPLDEKEDWEIAEDDVKYYEMLHNGLNGWKE